MVYAQYFMLYRMIEFRSIRYSYRRLYCRCSLADPLRCGLQHASHNRRECHSSLCRRRVQHSIRSESAFKLEHATSATPGLSRPVNGLSSLRRVPTSSFRRLSFSHLIAGQLPRWDAGRYGIPADIIAQTDRTALWALVCTVEALVMAGISDSYELYQHPSEVGTSISSGIAGMEPLSAISVTGA